jgi:7-carboxy-7-deazaguanine synthase
MNFKNLVLLKKKDQLKFVIGDENDLEYAIKFIGEHPTEANVIFSPVGGMELLPLAERVVDDKLDVRVLPQLHKIIWGDKRSV